MSIGNAMSIGSAMSIVTSFKGKARTDQEKVLRTTAPMSHRLGFLSPKTTHSDAITPTAHIACRWQPSWQTQFPWPEKKVIEGNDKTNTVAVWRWCQDGGKKTAFVTGSARTVQCIYPS